MDLFVFVSMICSALFHLLMFSITDPADNLQSKFMFKFVPMVITMCLLVSIYHTYMTQ